MSYAFGSTPIRQDAQACPADYIYREQQTLNAGMFLVNDRITDALLR